MEVVLFIELFRDYGISRNRPNAIDIVMTLALIPIAL